MTQSNDNAYDLPTTNMKLLIADGLSSVLAVQAGDLVRWTQIWFRKGYYLSTKQTYRSTVRGLIKKMPGFFFSGLTTVQFNS